MEDMSGRESHDPEAADDAADSEDPVTGDTVVEAKAIGFTGAKNLAADADNHEKSADCESEPCHSGNLSTVNFTKL